MSETGSGAGIEELVRGEPEELPSDIVEKLAALEREYPGQVVLLKKGQELYHQSRNPEGLISSNSFDPGKAIEAGYVWFTDVPQKATNIEAVLQGHLIAHDDRPRALRYRETKEPPLPYSVLAGQGFQASIGKGGNAIFTTVGSEVVVFPSGSKVLENGIKPYVPKK